jgi:hypothetical protein
MFVQGEETVSCKPRMNHFNWLWYGFQHARCLLITPKQDTLSGCACSVMFDHGIPITWYQAMAVDECAENCYKPEKFSRNL